MLNVKVDDNDNIIEYDIDFLGGFLNGEFAYLPLSVALTFALLIDRIIMDNETKDKLDLYNNPSLLSELEELVNSGKAQVTLFGPEQDVIGRRSFLLNVMKNLPVDCSYADSEKNCLVNCREEVKEKRTPLTCFVNME